ncbi:MAG: hypothetical protein U0324_22770 [Polyangiales bacterium]
MPPLLPLVFAVAAQVAGAAAPPRAPRRYGVHLGLNATLMGDALIGRYAYVGIATQLTGVAAIFAPERNYVVSAVAFGGVALPLVERDALRLTADVTPALGVVHSAPVNLLTVGLLAGVRLVHRSGFTAALRLPLVGYAGSAQARRGSVYYYYLSAIPSVPILTVGYTF